LRSRSDKFVPIDTVADTAKAIALSKKFNLNTVFSTDGDRLLISDENGNWLRGDILGLLCAKTLNIEALAVLFICNAAIELSGFFNYFARTMICSHYVIAEFANLVKKFNSVTGFEARGGFLLGSVCS
jgi:phosphomannomutase